MTKNRLVSLSRLRPIVVGLSCTSTQETPLQSYLDKAPFDCGTLELPQGGCTSNPDAAISCFRQALAAGNTGVHFGVAAPSEEGDLIVTHLFVDNMQPGAAPVIQFYDSRNDNWGPKMVTQSTCANVTYDDNRCGIPQAILCEEM